VKKLIEGKLYSTESARHVAGAYSDQSRNTENLYLTPNGAWFLHRYSGWEAAAEDVSHEIEAITAKEALEWLEQSGATFDLDDEDVRTHLGSVEAA